jgi:hypothetical protein
MDRKLLLVGSIPFDTVSQVFESFGTSLGDELIALPDGEVGPRRHWISRVHYQVFAGHPDLEIVRRPQPDNGVERLHPRNAADSWQFKVKPGVDQVRFGDPGWRLGCTRDAVNSYFVFRTLREKGQLPAHLRFQVSLPSVNSLTPPRVFPDTSDLDRIKPGLEAAMQAEVAKIVELIPAKDLAIQWDCATEVQDAYGAIRELPPDGMIERNVRQFRTLSAQIPDDVLLGYHFCFGTLGGWPRFRPDDLSATVTLANAVVEASGRRVDWLHLPTLDRTDDAFFAPLQRLEPRGARVYLGAIHNMGSFAERLALARKYLPDFGLAAYCGLGRHEASEMPRVLDEHRQALHLAG